VTTFDDVLAGEHAAIYGYGVLGAHLSGTNLALAQQAEAAHRARRDNLLLRLASASPPPPGADPAYALPFPVTDQASALQLATGIEERTGDLWKAALGAVTGDDRHRALDALTDCALRAARFRRAAGQNPGTVPLP
jgi:hypothetical protein